MVIRSAFVDGDYSYSILRGASIVYGWPSEELPPRMRRGSTVAPEVLARCEGTYQVGTSAEQRLVTRRVDGHLQVTIAGILDLELQPIAGGRFALLDSMSGKEYELELSGSAPAPSLQIHKPGHGARRATRVLGE